MFIRRSLYLSYLCTIVIFSLLLLDIKYQGYIYKYVYIIVVMLIYGKVPDYRPLNDYL